MLFIRNKKGFGESIAIPFAFILLFIFILLSFVFVAIQSEKGEFETLFSHFADNELNDLMKSYMDSSFDDDMTMYDAISEYCDSDCSKIEEKTKKFFSGTGHFIDFSVVALNDVKTHLWITPAVYSGVKNKKDNEFVINIPTKSYDVDVRVRIPRARTYEELKAI